MELTRFRGYKWRGTLITRVPLGLKTCRGMTENNLVPKPPHNLSTTGRPGYSPGMLEGTERRGLMCETSDPGGGQHTPSCGRGQTLLLWLFQA